MYRDKTKVIKIGNRVIGGGNPILIQSMTNTRTEDVEATIAQILRLEEAGCEIIRCTVPTIEAAKAIPKIKEKIFDGQSGSVVPLCFNYDHYNLPLCLLGVAKLKTYEKGISADCYICDVLDGRMVKELINSGTPFELGMYANDIESTTHGDETIITKGTIKEVSIVPVENVIYPIEIDKETN